MIRFSSIAWATFTLFLSACTVSVLAGQPKPNLPLAQPTGKSLALTVSNDVQNDFTMPAHGGFKETEVHGWRDTLSAGFRNGFAGYYQLDGGDSSDVRIELQRADLAWALKALGRARGSVAAQVTYKARLLDRSGATLAVAAGTVESKRPVVEMDEATEAVSTAVEAMYEEMTQKLQQKLP